MQLIRTQCGLDYLRMWSDRSHRDTFTCCMLRMTCPDTAHTVSKFILSSFACLKKAILASEDMRLVKNGSSRPLFRLERKDSATAASLLKGRVSSNTHVTLIQEMPLQSKCDKQCNEIWDLCLFRAEPHTSHRSDDDYFSSCDWMFEPHASYASWFIRLVCFRCTSLPFTFIQKPTFPAHPHVKIWYFWLA